MNISLKKPIQKFKSTEGKKKVSLFLICLLCSFVFWVFIKLSQESEASFQYTIEVSQLPEDQFFVPQQNADIDVKYLATGARFVFSGMIAKSGKLEIGHSNFLKLQGTDSSKFFITSNRIEELLLVQTGPNVEIVSIWPDTVFFRSHQTTQKLVPVVFNDENLSFQSGYKLYGDVEIEPDSVMINVPVYEAGKVNFAFVLNNKYKDLEKTRIFESHIMPDSKVSKFKFSPDHVRVTIPVEKFTELSLQADIHVICDEVIYELDDFDELRTMPSKVTVNALVALKDYSNIQAEMFVFTVNCNEFQGENKASKLSVLLNNYPGNIVINSYSPEKVDYILLK